MQDIILKILGVTSWPGTVAFVAFVVWQLAPKVLTWWRITPESSEDTLAIFKQVRELMQFKAEAEGNHYTDLAKLLESDKEQWRHINEIHEYVGKIREDVAYIKGKIGNGYNH